MSPNQCYAKNGTELPPPQVVRGLAKAVLAAHVIGRHVGLDLTQEVNDLFFGKNASSRPISFLWGTRLETG